MGHYFVMSRCFNKSDPSDFGFVSLNSTTAINPKDGKTWIRTSLYDFGWGKENGYYQDPLPDVDGLFDIVFYSKDEDDVYGAASVILEQYPDELLQWCERLMNDRVKRKLFIRFTNLFRLTEGTNKSPILHKTLDQIQADHVRWIKVSEAALKMKRGFTLPFMKFWKT